MRPYLTVIIILVLIFGSIAGYLYNQFQTLANTDFTPPPILVTATRAKLETWPSTLEAVGTIRATRGAKLAAETSGEIIAISVRSGEQVSAGQLLLTLNDSVEQASKERQQANLVLARQLHQRDASLVKQKSIPQSQYDRSRANLDADIATLAEIEARLDNKRIVAPFPGTLGIIAVKTGDYIESGTAITTLQDLTQLEVDFSVPARHFAQLRRGLTISLQTAASSKQFSATLEAMDATVDQATRNLALRARVMENEGLLPGMFAQLTINLDRPRELVTVPETAVTYSLQGNTVYLIEEGPDGMTVTPRVVQSGAVKNGRIAVTDGLEPGDQVVSVGQNKLYRGARVALQEHSPDFSQ